MPTKASVVFVSHARADALHAKKLARALRAEGIAPWLADEQVTAGKILKREIENAIESADFFLALISKHVANDGYYRQEWDLAIRQTSGFLIPVRLRDCTVPHALSKYKYITLYPSKGPQGFLRDGLNELLNLLRRPPATKSLTRSGKSRREADGSIGSERKPRRRVVKPKMPGKTSALSPRKGFGCPKVPDDLVQACLEGNGVLYAGSGLSAPLGLPTWRPFLNGLLEWCATQELLSKQSLRSLEQALDAGDLDVVADRVVTIAGRESWSNRLNEYLSQVFIREAGPLTECHRLLAGIGFSAGLTTNFDDFLERAFSIPPTAALTPHDTDGLLTAMSKREFFVLKLYGILNRPETVMLSPGQFKDFVIANRAFTEFMEALFVSRTLLFIGSSIEGISWYLDGLRIRGSSRQHYALVAVNEGAWEARAEELKERFGIHVLPYSESPDHPEVRDFLTKLFDKVKRGRGATVAAPDQSSTLKRIRLTNIGPFESFELEFNPHWNVLLGDNGLGKSTILKAIALGMCGEDGKMYAGRLLRTGCPEGRIELETTGGGSYVTRINQSVSAPIPDVLALGSRPLEAEGLLAIGFPPIRSATWKPISGAQVDEQKQRPTVSDLLPLLTGDPDPRLDQLKQWLVNLDYWINAAAIREQSPTSDAPNLFSEAHYRNLRAELEDLVGKVTGRMDIELLPVELSPPRVMVKIANETIPVDAVSQGTASLLGWTCAVLQRMYAVFRDKESPRAQTAIVLIDEPDAHMHPEWQQDLVPTLSDLFPNVQFIATTHSPLIVGGMPADQVVRLARDDDGRVVRIPIPDDMMFGRTHQILTSRLFNLDTTLDRWTQKLTGEYQRLLGLEHRTPEEETEFRRLEELLQARMPLSNEETPVERRAMELFEALLHREVGEEFERVRADLKSKAENLFDEIAAERKIRP